MTSSIILRSALVFALTLKMALAQGAPAAEAGPVLVPLSQPVQTISLNGTWQFYPVTGKPADEEIGAKSLDQLAANWQHGALPATNWFPLTVPQFLNRYSWWLDISDKFVAADQARLDALPFDVKKVQAGWYLRRLVVPKISGPLPEVVANFEGVAMISRVYCNGQLVGQHTGMFGSLNCRLTPYLKPGATNDLLVYAERGANVKNADAVLGVAVSVSVTRGMLSSLNHGMFGGFGRTVAAKFLGIWQPVTLKISQPGGRIEDVFFKPTLDGHDIQYTLVNSNVVPVTGILRCKITDQKTGELLNESETAITNAIAPGQSREGIFSASGLHPKLWTPDHPNLYDLTLEWCAPDERVLDRWSEAVGYRTVQVKGSQVYLNGQPYWCRGAGQPIYGYKPTDATTAHAFLRLMHEGNEMVTRTGCNPWNEIWYSAADTEGVGVSSEGVRPWALMSRTPPPAKPLLEQWKQEQVDTVRRYRNHPSILFWCISNEGLQGDAENPEKIAIFRDIIKAVRQVDPTRPIIQTSGDPDIAHNAEIEDVHAYWGWYEPSSYVNDYNHPRRGLSGTAGHAFLNEECAVPYQNTDTGGVHPAYIGRYSAHPWVGEFGVTNADPEFFAEHIRAEAKLKSEKLRYQRREQPTAGALLFANTTWVQDVLTQPPARWRPFPVYDAVRLGFAPVLIAWGTSQYNFFAGDTLQTRLYVVNDDADFRDLKNLSAEVEIFDATGRSLNKQSVPLGDVNYFAVRDWPLALPIPATASSERGLAGALVRLTLLEKGYCIATNEYPIRIASRDWADGHSEKSIVVEGCNDAMQAELRSSGAHLTSLKDAESAGAKADVIILGPQATKVAPSTVSACLKPDGRVLVLEQAAQARRFFADLRGTDQAVASTADEKNSIDDFMYDQGAGKSAGSAKLDGEFVEMLGWRTGSPIFSGLSPMDWKWWAQGEGRPAFVCSASHSINPKEPGVIALGRYLAPHFYWSGNLKKVYESKLSYPVFAVRRPWGELLVCELNLSKAVALDPRAARTLNNLINQPLP